MYNHLVKLRNRVKTDYSDIDIQLHKRSSLIQNVVDLVREYAKHENSTFKEVAAARSALNTSKNAQETADADNILTQTLRSLMMVTEDYPELKASENFQQVRSDLLRTEDEIAHYRETYNATAERYNNQIQLFPNMLVAGLLSFEEAVLFKPSSSEPFVLDQSHKLVDSNPISAKKKTTKKLQK
ncbi:MAG: LemA family protein [bacterium]